MSYLPPRLASQLLNFINYEHIYTDEVSRESFEEIEAAAEKEPEETMLGNITRRKGKARRSVGPQYPSEWAKSKESFRKAILKFQAGNSPQSPDAYIPITASKSKAPTPINNKRISVIDNSENFPIHQGSNMTRGPRNIENSCVCAVPKDITSFFNGIEKLDDSNWSVWKGHMQDNLDLCDLWEIVIGEESRPHDTYDEELRSWIRREKIARTIIKNALGTKDYSQVRFTRNAAEIWRTLITLHQSTGAQGKADLIWKFWSMRCEEGASVRIHVGEVRALHLELAEFGIVIERYFLAIVLCKSLPPSYDSFISTIFANIIDLDNADPDYIARKIFEEEMRRVDRSEDANTATHVKCQNCKKIGHIKVDFYSKGGGKVL